MSIPHASLLDHTYTIRPAFTSPGSSDSNQNNSSTFTFQNTTPSHHQNSRSQNDPSNQNTNFSSPSNPQTNHSHNNNNNNNIDGYNYSFSSNQRQSTSQSSQFNHQEHQLNNNHNNHNHNGFQQTNHNDNSTNRHMNKSRNGYNNHNNGAKNNNNNNNDNNNNNNTCIDSNENTNNRQSKHSYNSYYVPHHYNNRNNHRNNHNETNNLNNNNNSQTTSHPSPTSSNNNSNTDINNLKNGQSGNNRNNGKSHQYNPKSTYYVQPISSGNGKTRTHHVNNPQNWTSQTRNDYNRNDIDNHGYSQNTCNDDRYTDINHDGNDTQSERFPHKHFYHDDINNNQNNNNNTNSTTNTRRGLTYIHSTTKKKTQHGENTDKKTQKPHNINPSKPQHSPTRHFSPHISPSPSCISPFQDVGADSSTKPHDSLESALTKRFQLLPHRHIAALIAEATAEVENIKAAHQHLAWTDSIDHFLLGNCISRKRYLRHKLDAICPMILHTYCGLFMPLILYAKKEPILELLLASFGFDLIQMNDLNHDNYKSFLPDPIEFLHSLAVGMQYWSDEKYKIMVEFIHNLFQKNRNIYDFSDISQFSQDPLVLSVWGSNKDELIHDIVTAPILRKHLYNMVRQQHEPNQQDLFSKNDHLNEFHVSDIIDPSRNNESYLTEQLHLFFISNLFKMVDYSASTLPSIPTHTEIDAELHNNGSLANQDSDDFASFVASLPPPPPLTPTQIAQFSSVLQSRTSLTATNLFSGSIVNLSQYANSQSDLQFDSHKSSLTCNTSSPHQQHSPPLNSLRLFHFVICHFYSLLKMAFLTEMELQITRRACKSINYNMARSSKLCCQAQRPAQPEKRQDFHENLAPGFVYTPADRANQNRFNSDVDQYGDNMNGVGNNHPSRSNQHNIPQPHNQNHNRLLNNSGNVNSFIAHNSSNSSLQTHQNFDNDYINNDNNYHNYLQNQLDQLYNQSNGNGYHNEQSQFSKGSSALNLLPNTNHITRLHDDHISAQNHQNQNNYLTQNQINFQNGKPHPNQLNNNYYNCQPNQSFDQYQHEFLLKKQSQNPQQFDRHQAYLTPAMSSTVLPPPIIPIQLHKPVHQLPIHPIKSPPQVQKHVQVGYQYQEISPNRHNSAHLIPLSSSLSTLPSFPQVNTHSANYHPNQGQIPVSGPIPPGLLPIMPPPYGSSIGSPAPPVINDFNPLGLINPIGNTNLPPNWNQNQARDISNDPQFDPRFGTENGVSLRPYQNNITQSQQLHRVIDQSIFAYHVEPLRSPPQIHSTSLLGLIPITQQTSSLQANMGPGLRNRIQNTQHQFQNVINNNPQNNLHLPQFHPSNQSLYSTPLTKHGQPDDSFYSNGNNQFIVQNQHDMNNLSSHHHHLIPNHIHNGRSPDSNNPYNQNNFPHHPPPPYHSLEPVLLNQHVQELAPGPGLFQPSHLLSLPQNNIR